MVKNAAFRILLILVVAIVGLVLFLAGFREVRHGYMAVELSTIGQYRIMPQPLQAGWYWRRPLIVTLMEYPMTRQQLQGQVTAITQDKKALTIKFLVEYQLSKDKLVSLHKAFGDAYTIRERLRDFCESTILDQAKEQTRAALFGPQRHAVQKVIAAHVAKYYGALGVHIQQFLIRDVRFPDDYLTHMARYSTQVLTDKVTKNCLTRDKREVQLTLQINHHIKAEDTEYIHEHLGIGYRERYVQPTLACIAYDIVAHYTFEELYSQQRTAIVQQILQKARQQLLQQRIQLDSVSLDALHFDRRYQQMLEQYARQVITTNIRKDCHTKDRKRLTLVLQVQHHIQAADALYVHRNIGVGYKEKYIVPTMRSVAYEVAAHYTLDEIFATKRAEVLKQILVKARQYLAPRKLQIDDVTLENIVFEKGYQQILDDIQRNEKELQRIKVMAQVTEQRAAVERLRRQREREDKKLDAQAETERRILQAEGERKAAMIKARGEAEAMSAVEEGRARALLKIQALISKNPHLLQYLYIDKLSDKVKVIVVPANAQGVPLQQVLKSVKTGE